MWSAASEDAVKDEQPTCPGMSGGGRPYGVLRLLGLIHSRFG
jgi:hypothetical protein